MKKLIFVLFSLLSLSSVSYAALTDLGNGQIEDSTQNIVWLQDASVFKTLCDANDPIATGFVPITPTATAGSICFDEGRMAWQDAEAWIARLNSQSYLGFTDWRQPKVSQPDAGCSLQFQAAGFIDQGYGLNCFGSEIVHLYINELTLNPAACPGGSACFQNSIPFMNIGIFNYWTGTPVLSFADSSFNVSTSAQIGRQLLSHNGSRWYVWPVRPATAALPEITMRLYGHPRENSAARGAIVIRTGSTAAPLTVNLTITDGSATSGVDYVAIPTTIVIPAGSDEATVLVTPIDDAIVEALLENVNIEVAASADYTIGVLNSIDVSIVDDDGVPEASITAIDNGAEPTTDGLFSIVRVGGDLTAPLEVNIAVLGGTAQNGIDYTGLPASVIIPANRLSIDVIIDVIDDALIEGTEVVKLDVGAAAGGEYTIHATLGSATLDIVDDDALAFVSVTTSDAVASETGPDNGQFTVARTGSTLADLVVNLGFSGAATNGSDYAAIPAMVTIPAGAATVTIDITPIDDAEIEGDENVIIHITAALAGEYGSGGANGNAQLNIMDNDTAPITVTPNTNPIPTLAIWALILVSLLLMLVAMPMLQLRKE